MAIVDPSKNIKSMAPVQRAIYAYTTPNDRTHDGWIKIGDTEAKADENLKTAVDERISQQTHTSDTKTKLEWTGRAKFEDDDKPFRDYDFHRYLTTKKDIERKPKTEWFKTDSATSKGAFYEFRENHGILSELTGVQDYQLREEQERFVSDTVAYHSSHTKGEVLWNAKPRFGKTLSVYDFCKRIGAVNILILTNRPAIADSWYNDYVRFVGTEGGYYFVSHVDALKGRKHVIPSREKYSEIIVDAMTSGKEPLGCIEFVSLQDLKGSIYHGGNIDKLVECSDYVDSHGRFLGIKWDVLVLDEAHEGVETDKSDVAIDHIVHKFTINLSGTPFKMLANDKFPDEAVFNWTYADEQRRKRELAEKGEENPYEELPKLNLYTYQMSEMMDAKAGAGTIIDDEEVQYYFDLNEFFKTDTQGYFEHLQDVQKILDALTVQKKYPFSTPELRSQLKHTFWLLNRVDSAKALKKLLELHPVFSQYRIILAAGSGDDESENRKAINEVKDAILTNEYTITLSVGQLTTGVTIPEWSGVLMLCSLKSPALYMQAAFRAQNPCLFEDKDGQTYRKNNAYVFDFDPARTLTIMETIANDQYKDTAGGAGDSDSRKQHVRELLNFFPVVGEDDDGQMIELDAEKVLSIPRHIHAKEVVRHGFMSNFLFQNIGGIFAAPAVVTGILGKIDPVSKEEAGAFATEEDKEKLGVDDKGVPIISDDHVIGLAIEKFGNPVFGDVVDDFKSRTEDMISRVEPSENEKMLDQIEKAFRTTVTDTIVAKAKDDYGRDMTLSQKRDLENKLRSESEKKFKKDAADFKIKVKTAELARDDALKECLTAEDEERIQKDFLVVVEQEKKALIERIGNTQELVNKATTETIKAVEHSRVEKKKKVIEDKVRDHLRGFARTIPSFLMAYGNDETTLETFEVSIPESVFEAVTSITVKEFRFLRDGGDYNDDNGEKKHYEGHLFDSVVFNDSVKEFLKKRSELSNYFTEGASEDIFNYIPPQRTNQIYTPKPIVRQMVDLFEEENPGCFDDPDHTFADLYMKSGLYITEIVKRLYQSEKMKSLYPDDSKRLEHIMEHQVYGAAPTEIIYMIAMHYIFGYRGDIGNWSVEELQTLYPNFVLKDTADLAKAGTLAEWASQTFKDAFDDEAVSEIKNSNVPLVDPSSESISKATKRKKKKTSGIDIEEGSEIVHKTYGAGEVVSLEFGKIEIRFYKGNVVKKFPFPDENTEKFLDIK